MFYLNYRIIGRGKEAEGTIKNLEQYEGIISGTHTVMCTLQRVVDAIDIETPLRIILEFSCDESSDITILSQPKVELFSNGFTNKVLPHGNIFKFICAFYSDIRKVATAEMTQVILHQIDRLSHAQQVEIAMHILNNLKGD